MLESASLVLAPRITPFLSAASKSVGVRRLTLREVPAYGSLTLPVLLQAVTLPELIELTLDTFSFSTMRHDDFRYGIGSSLRTLNLVVDDFDDHESAALATVLEYTTSINHIAVHCRFSEDIERVFSVAGSVLEDRPIETLTFSSDIFLDIWQTSGTGDAVRTITSLWRRGVLKSVSMRPLNDVRAGAATALKGLSQGGLALDVRGVDGRSLLEDW